MSTFDLEHATLTTPGRVERWVRDDRTWLTAALAMNLLIGWDGDEASTLAWMNPLLFVAALAIRVRDARHGAHRWRPHGAIAVIAMIAIGWAVGMTVELTIASGGDGYGGMHHDTRPSFILAQGFYVPTVLLTWWVVRRYGLDTRRAFFFAGAVAWWEFLTVGLAALLSPYFALAPVLVAYYFATYALCGMAGLLVVDPVALSSSRPRTISDRRLLALGALTGVASWTLFMAWAVMASRAFGFSL